MPYIEWRSVAQAVGNNTSELDLLWGADYLLWLPGSHDALADLGSDYLNYKVVKPRDPQMCRKVKLG